jgi:hypothetical protein
MALFQVKLGGKFEDYSNQEDKILKRAFMAGFPNAKFSLRGQNYEYDFKQMMQINKVTGKSRTIRAPKKWKAPTKPLVPPGKTTVINVPRGAPGTTIHVPYPGKPGAFIAVNVPKSAKPGQAMLVPVPDAPVYATAATSGGCGGSASPAPAAGWSTGGKVAAGAAAVVGVGAAAVGGAILGDHIAEHGLDATVDVAVDGLADAGEAIEDFAVDAGEFVVDAAEDAGDFIMDLF